MKHANLISWGFSLLFSAFLAVCVSFPWTAEDRFSSHAVIAAVLQKIENQYVHPYNEQELTEKALSRFVEGLDQWSTYYSPEQYRDFDEDTEGRFGGIGVFFTLKGDRYVIDTVLPGGPAAQSGLEKGDCFLETDGVALSDKTIHEVKRFIRGVPGTPVVLLMLTPEGTEKTVTVIREIVHSPSVYRVGLIEEHPEIGFFRIAQFQRGTSGEVQKAIDNLSTRRIEGLIVDLRGNPGGLYDEAVNVADLFLSEGVIVKTRGKEKADRKSIRATASATDFTKKVVLLINGNTASAAELVSAALREHDKAQLVGAPSYGKFCVQTVYELFGHGEQYGALKLTTKKYLTPNGSALKGDHIMVDFKVEQSEEALQKLRDQWSETLRLHWDRPLQLLPDPIGTADDAVLQKAVEVLAEKRSASSAPPPDREDE